jgi:glycerol-3-phosphate dehydrogenase (NAD(P)+)
LPSQPERPSKRHRKRSSRSFQQVVEGVLAARAVKEVADDLGIEMPICQQIYRILYEGVSPRAAVEALMGRELKPESE